MREVAGRRRQNGNAAKDDCGQSEVDRGEGIAHREAQRRLIEGWRTAMPEIATWMIAMAKDDLALSTMRVRQATVSSFCIWLVKCDLLSTNLVEKLDRPKVERRPPRGVPESTLMDILRDWSTRLAGTGNHA